MVYSVKRKKTILIAEDDQEMLQIILKAILSKRRTEYEVILCVDGIEALVSLEEREIDLAILDLLMRDVDGMEVCEAMKKSDKLKEVPIIISSGHIDQAAAEKLQHMGIEHYLRKPYTMEKLISAIDVVLKFPTHAEQ